jgi:hypothetical protein
MFDGDSDARVENDWVVDVPAIGLRVPAHDSPLIEIRTAVIRGVARTQPPSHQKVIFRSCAPNRRNLLSVDIDLLVPFAKPGWTARPHCQDGADIVPFALGVQDQIVFAVLDGVFLPVLGVKIGRVFGQFGFLDPVDIIVEQT